LFAKNQKITVIGGSGFVGTHLCRKLWLSHQDFEILDLKISNEFPEKSKLADVRDVDSLLKTITGDVIVNLAAIHRDDVRDRLEYERTNVGGAENITDASTELGIKRIIFTSSVAVYGFAEPGTDETGKINPFNEYGRTKFEAEKIFQNWQARNNNNLIIVRPTVIFGAGNRGNIFNLFNQIASGRFIMIGKGNNKKSIAYIDNLVAFLEACIASNTRYALYNYVDTPDFSMNELVKCVRKKLKGKNNVGLRIPYWMGICIGYAADLITTATGKNLPVSSIRVKKFTSHSEFRSAMGGLNGFKPPFSLSEGIDHTLECEFISPDPDNQIFYSE